MGIRLILTIVFIAITGIISQKIWKLLKPLEAPTLDLNAYWGRGDVANYKEDPSIKRQEIKFPEESIDALKAKLNEPLWLPEQLEGTTKEYGMNINELATIVEHWKTNYLPRWNERQEFLNSLPHYLTQIQGLKIHFIHAKPTNIQNKRVLPLLLLHGWPGSVREFYDFIPMLTTASKDTDYVFEVIAPSLPGYAWSEGSKKINFGPAEIAVVLRNLMIRLGHDQFVVQGGDWGSVIGSHLTTLFPENVLAYHSNFCVLETALAFIKVSLASFWPSKFVDPKYETFVFPLKEKMETLIEQTGYLHLQATKPDTLGLTVSRNPVGLAAYLMEKFSIAFNKYDIDSILDNIMIYYLTDCATTSFRLYAEGFSKHQRAYELQRVPTSVPTGCVRFKRDIAHRLDWQLKDKYKNLVHSTWQEKGGHFAAWETPELLYNDFIVFVNKVFSNDNKKQI